MKGQNLLIVNFRRFLTIDREVIEHEVNKLKTYYAEISL